ncbi:MAG: hypothetical protein M1822_007600 [Bathelium mastoideum]|nr:MAG: hypothetical protein M1822_007600 [Bathelium mastoideum]
MYDSFISQNQTPSLKQLHKVLPTLLSIIPSTRIIVDGLDECDASQYKRIVSELTACLAKREPGAGSCKILITSQDVPQISRLLGRRSQISLYDEHQAINSAIQKFVESKVHDLEQNLGDFSHGGDAMAAISQALVDKAEGLTPYARAVKPELTSFSYNRIWARIESSLDENRRATAIRIFEWIAFSERPLKKHEVQGGVTLHRENKVINEETHISRNVFDTCKPLLEDGPHDTIRLVHSSVKEYLLKHKTSFKRGLLPHYDIAFSCTNYLSASLSLVDPDYDEDRRMIDVGKDLHGLQIYMNEFWMEHVLTYADLACGESDTLPASDLTAVLQIVSTRHESIWSKVNPSIEERLRKNLPGPVDSRVDLFKHHPDVHSLLKMLSAFRKLPNGAAAGKSSDVLRDPTLFTPMLHKYHDMVQRLGTAKSIEGLSDTRLAAFKRVYGSTAFLCRIRGCPRASHGFESENDRAEHEKTHSLNLYCNDLSCPYNKLGFMTAHALKKHMLQCHPVSQKKPPDALRRGRQMSESARASPSNTEVQDEEEDHQLVDDFEFPSERITATKRPDPKLENEDSFALATTSWYTAES